MNQLFDIETLSFINETYETVGLTTASFSNASTIFEGDNESIVWIKSSLLDYQKYLDESKASIIVCDKKTIITDSLMKEKCFIICNDPKLVFLKIIEHLFIPPKLKPYIHPTAIIDNESTIDSSVRIEAYCIIGKCIIGKNSIIQANSIVRDNSYIGNNVVIHSNVVIGSDGFGFVREKDGQLKKFPHIGKVIIEDDVEIYPFSNVDIGTLGKTIIKKGSKIDHYCHIGHNSEVGENSLITAGTVLCGGSKIGNNVWIGVNSVIKEKVVVGDEALIGISSVVSKFIPPGETWVGAPAEPLEQFKKNRKTLTSLINKKQNET